MLTNILGLAATIVVIVILLYKVFNELTGDYK